ncbi:cytochrome c oxidase subunit 1 [Mycobacteroides abscessus]|nr:cytochrome c oxidase subunit 1 [Mycobacteroides abscessus]
MATSSVELTASRPFPPRVGPKGSLIYRLVTTTDHKLIGIMYLVTCFAFFMVGGLMALLIRAELTTPGLAFLSNEQYNQLFTMHGTAMLLFYATPIVFGFANVVLPLQIGAPDVAFPRLNALSFWLFLFGALIALAGFITPGGAADFGWTAYTPLSDAIHSPGAGGDLWILGVAVGGLGTILGAVNMITTIVCMRAPGMVMFRMPIFTWNILVVSVLVLLVFPLLAAAAIGLEADRRLGAHLYDPANGGVLLWQHLFWFFGHPEVYVLALPFFGVVSEIFPVFSRKPIFGYTTLVFATLGIGALSIAVWAHHMYATGAVLLPFFSFMTFLIAVPTGIKFFNWIGTMWKGQLTFETPMLFSIGFLVTFLARSRSITRRLRRSVITGFRGLVGSRGLSRAGISPHTALKSRTIRTPPRIRRGRVGRIRISIRDRKAGKPTLDLMRDRKAGSRIRAHSSRHLNSRRRIRRSSPISSRNSPTPNASTT